MADPNVIQSFFKYYIEFYSEFTHLQKTYLPTREEFFGLIQDMLIAPEITLLESDKDFDSVGRKLVQEVLILRRQGKF